MSYVLDNLLPNELIKYEWKVHLFYKIIMILWMLFWFLITISWWGVFGWAIMLNFLYWFLLFVMTEIVVTDKRVLYKTWIIARNVFELQLNKVESASLNQTIFQRIIWAWTLVISWTWGNNKPIRMLANPTDMKTIIYSTIEK